MFRSVLPLVLLAMAALMFTTPPAKADPLPGLGYFYTCASDVENCNDPGFAVEYNGNFGMDGLTPINSQCYGSPKCYTLFGVVSSNTSGEVVGNVNDIDGVDAAYGFDGQVFCLVSKTCKEDDLAAVAINDNGIWVVNSTAYPYIVIGAGTQYQETITGDDLGNLLGLPLVIGPFALGINDYNQVLVSVEYQPIPNRTDFLEGILSPFPVVPEPPSISLLATALGMLGLAARLHLSKKKDLAQSVPVDRV